VVVNDQGYEYITLLVQGRSLLMHGGANGRWGCLSRRGSVSSLYELHLHALDRHVARFLRDSPAHKRAGCKIALGIIQRKRKMAQERSCPC